MLRQSVYSGRSTVTSGNLQVSNRKEKDSDLGKKPSLAWIQKLLPFLKAKSNATLRSEDDNTLQEGSSLPLGSESVRTAHLQEFLSTERQYQSSLLINYEKLDSHLSVLSFLAGGMQFRSFDLDLINDLSNVSKYFINAVECDRILEYNMQVAQVYTRLLQFTNQIGLKFDKFSKQFPGSELAIVHFKNNLGTLIGNTENFYLSL
jgi:hypothetical protein